MLLGLLMGEDEKEMAGGGGGGGELIDPVEFLAEEMM